jgi:hypothetical protein
MNFSPSPSARSPPWHVWPLAAIIFICEKVAVAIHHDHKEHP